MSIWDSYVREAEVGTGYTAPSIPDDLYEAVIEQVGEPFEQPNPFDADRPRTVFTVDWRITGGDHDGVQLRQWIRIPESYLEFGILDERSTLYNVLEALGQDMSSRFVVDPRQWVGAAARIMVENRTNQRGETRPQITRVMPPRQTAQGTAQQAAGAPPAPARGAQPAQRQSWPPRAR